MREIKFRAKAAAGFWVAGSLFVNERGEAYIYYPDGSRYPVSTETVGEFTSLKDKNGKEIYEGDIIEALVWKEPYARRTSKKHRCEVIFSNGEFQPKWYPLPEGFRTIPVLERSEVIGNIYDNRELLK